MATKAKTHGGATDGPSPREQLASLAAEMKQLKAQVSELTSAVAALEAAAPRGLTATAPTPLTSEQVREAVKARPNARFRVLQPYPLKGLSTNEIFDARNRFANVDELASHVAGDLRIAAA